VAVLPFDNIRADASDAYLAQGLPEMILNRLSRIESLSVVACNSSFALPAKDIDAREIGRRLDSGYNYSTILNEATFFRDVVIQMHGLMVTLMC
jgi:TolB-like protein